MLSCNFADVQSAVAGLADYGLEQSTQSAVALDQVVDKCSSYPTGASPEGHLIGQLVR